MADKWIEAAEREINYESRKLGIPVINSIAVIIQRHYEAWFAAQQSADDAPFIPIDERCPVCGYIACICAEVA